MKTFVWSGWKAGCTDVVWTSLRCVSSAEDSGVCGHNTQSMSIFTTLDLTSGYRRIVMKNLSRGEEFYGTCGAVMLQPRSPD